MNNIRKSSASEDLVAARLLRSYQRERRTDIWLEVKWFLCDIGIGAIAILIMVLVMWASR